ncbi:hypothetical protein Lser_V15G40184 [Lactuca serriola]
MVSQVVAGLMMIEALKDKGYNGYIIVVRSPTELFQIFKLTSPVFIMMMSKVKFCSLLMYIATSMGTQTVVEYQVLVQVYCMFAVGVSNFHKLHTHLCQSLFMALKEVSQRCIIWVNIRCCRNNFHLVILLDFFHLIMDKVLLPYFIALCVTTSTQLRK